MYWAMNPRADNLDETYLLLQTAAGVDCYGTGYVPRRQPRPFSASPELPCRALFVCSLFLASRLSRAALVI